MAIEISIRRGQELLDGDAFDVAISEFSAALKESPKSFKALIGRSTAYQRLKKFDDSLRDLLMALKVSKERNSRENIGLTYLRLAIVYFNRKEFGKSLKAVNLAQKFDSNDPSLGIWLSKITKKATQENILEEEIDELDESIEKTSDVKTTTTTTTTPDLKEKKPLQTPLPLESKTPKMSYYQSDDKLTIDFFYKNVSDPKIDFKSTSMNVEFKTLTGSDVIYDYKLFAPIIPEECSFKIMSTKVEVILRKKQPGKWSSLEGTGEDVITPDTTINTTTGAPPSSSSSSLQYPTSSKSKTDWANFKITDDDDDEEDASNADENAFFQKLYADADDDTKRAMMKSFVESNGTALSTNWDDTKEKKWGVTPPDGVEAKKW